MARRGVNATHRHRHGLFLVVIRRVIAMQSQIAVSVVRRIAGVRTSEDGQDLLEYALLVALIAIIAAGAVTTVGTTINGVFWSAIASSSV
jgi:Flp pilus assembly pilin Flp